MNIERQFAFEYQWKRMALESAAASWNAIDALRRWVEMSEGPKAKERLDVDLSTIYAKVPA